MAALVTIKQGTGHASKVISAIEMIRSGMGVLMELDQMRAEMISAGQPTMAAAFGCASDGMAQILSDRWGYVVAKWRDTSDTSFAALRDLVNTVQVQ